jgi:hypothetical protein
MPRRLMAIVLALVTHAFFTPSGSERKPHRSDKESRKSRRDI